MWLVQHSSTCLAQSCHVLQRAGSSSRRLGRWLDLHPVSSVLQSSIYFEVCRENSDDGMQLYCSGETPVAERCAISNSRWSRLISPADSWRCSGYFVGSSIPSVRLPSSCNMCRASSRYIGIVYGFTEPVVLRDSLTTFGIETRVLNKPHYHIVSEMASRLSGFRALASCVAVNMVRFVWFYDASCRVSWIFSWIEIQALELWGI